MYSEWASLQLSIENDTSNRSVLHSYSEVVGKEVAVSVVRQLSGHLSLTATKGDNLPPSPLDSEKQVLWTMEVICYGLSLPLTEHDALKNCVNIYCEWLSALTIPKHTVPPPLMKDPNHYVQKIFQHLINLFQPRPQVALSDANKQAVLCHRVLRTIQTVATESIVMTRQTWESLLRFLLAVNDTILAPPLEADPKWVLVSDKTGSLADQLCERLLSVLFEIWLLACARCFPSPTLWRTLNELCATWRHHQATVDQWNRITRVLTSSLLKILYGPDFPVLKIGEEDSQIIPAEMDSDCVAQSWFRFLHVLGNPVDLCRPKVIGKTPKFLSTIMTYEQPIDPAHHPCLRSLPKIFLKAMKGISVMVDAFLGLPSTQPAPPQPDPLAVKSPNSLHPDTPPQGRKGIKSSGGTKKERTSSTSQAHQQQFHQQQQQQQQQQVHSASSSSSLHGGAEDSRSADGFRVFADASHSSCNSILNLYGSWLFEAALTGCKLQAQSPTRRKSVAFDAAPYPLTNSGVGRMFRRHHSIAAPESNRSSGHFSDLRQLPFHMDNPPSAAAAVAANPLFDASEFPDNYEAGRAEACGALCRIFTSRTYAEDIMPVYLARFYIALYQGLRIDEDMSSQVLSSILYNSPDLFRIDLKGVQALIPDIITALEMVLPQKELQFRSQVSQTQLRRASIHLLLSMMSLPHHFKHLCIQELLTGKDLIMKDVDDGPGEPVTFLSLKYKLVDLMIMAVQCETDSYNTQMLLGAMHLCVLDSAMCEEVQTKENQRRKDKEKKENKLEEEESGDDELDNGEDIIENGHVSKRSSTISGSGQSSSSRSGSVSSTLSAMATHSDSAWVIFVRCCHLVCRSLMSTWSQDYSVALAALELLSGLAKIKIQIKDKLECKRTVRWICDHIIFQCSRPSMYHSRDLHSIIVAAFQCLSVWVIEHSYLLKDKECIQCILEVIELGISGTKSQHKASIPPVYKHEKELKPASMRVKDAAESVLSCILNHVDAFPNPCGPSSVNSLLDEESILRYIESPFLPDNRAKFKYFVLDNTTLLAVLEQPLGVSPDILPTVTAIMRGPTGRHAWTMQLRHSSKKDEEAAKARLQYPDRPEPLGDVPEQPEVTARNFPETVDMIPLTMADKSIPQLSAIETETSQEQHELLDKLIDDQAEYEKFVCDMAKENVQHAGYPNAQTECKPPNPCQLFSPARLILSHLGYLSLDRLKAVPTSPVPPALVALDESFSGFHGDLRLLDAIPSRTYDSVFVFYVKSGQKTSEEILNNVNSKSNVQPEFLEFLRSLGWPVDISKHAGWTGNLTTSWKMSFNATSSRGSREDLDLTSTSLQRELCTLFHINSDLGGVNEEENNGGSIYNGRKKVLYYADVISEIAFVVPSLKPEGQGFEEDQPVDENDASSDTKSTTSTTTTSSQGLLPLDVTAESATSTPQSTASSSSAPTVCGTSLERERSRKLSTRGGLMLGPEVRIIVAWLENFDDHASFPLDDLIPETSTGLEHLLNFAGSSCKGTAEPGIVVIYVHPLKTGLFRIHIRGKPSVAIPLVDGMVVSRRILGVLVRQTAINTCHRKRLESDAYSPPHVKRRQKIQDMVNKYRKQMSAPELYTSLFASGVR
ncbi:ral GTPase-activating protein subunit beta-like isoform X2 [Amphiura filiformis]|uniref:ral GTPase-activating protein subunit beta-like isoform X2 n=1 Tax=Amphiura filiformis TaxID=82378 RepID=UPI003B21964C